MAHGVGDGEGRTVSTCGLRLGRLASRVEMEVDTSTGSQSSEPGGTGSPPGIGRHLGEVIGFRRRYGTRVRSTFVRRLRSTVSSTHVGGPGEGGLNPVEGDGVRQTEGQQTFALQTKDWSLETLRGTTQPPN